MILDFSEFKDRNKENFVENALDVLACEAQRISFAIPWYSESEVVKDFEGWLASNVAIFDELMDGSTIIDTEKTGRMTEYYLERLFIKHEKIHRINMFAEENPDKVVF